MYECESWTIRKLTAKEFMLLSCGVGKTLESLLDYKESQSVHPKGNQSWIFMEKTDAEADAPKLWPPDVKNWLIRKESDAGKYWRWEKRAIEDKMVRWHHWLNGHEFGQTLGDGEGQGSLVCCSPWGHKQSDTTERLSNNNKTIL